MSKIRCGSCLCNHNTGEFCDVEEVNLVDHSKTFDGQRMHYWSCNNYEENTEIIEVVRKAIMGNSL